jgi:nucleotide-binding universal stress UspA family protein
MEPSNVARILLATDFSASAVLAHDYAEYLALSLQAALHIVTVDEGARPSASGEKQVQDEVKILLRTLQDGMKERGVRVSAQWVAGGASAQIVAAARQLDADVIVMGMQGHTHLSYGLLGSTVETVTKAGLCPVLTVPLPQKEASPSGMPAADTIAIGRILAPIDFSVPSLDSLEYAVQLARDLKANLILLHVLEPEHGGWDLTRMEEAERMRSSWEGRLAELVDVIKPLAVSATYDIRGGRPPDSILAGALQHKCDLIVMGTHGRQGREGANVGSVAQAVLKQAACPVLTVKNPKFPSGGRRLISGLLSQRKAATAKEAESL